MPRSDWQHGWDPLRSRDVLSAMWSSTPVPPVASSGGAGFRTMFLTLRRLVVGRLLKVRVREAELSLTVTEFDSHLDLRGLAVGQIGDVHIEARDICWDQHRVDYAIADLRNVHLRAGAPAVMVAAPVEFTLRFAAALLEDLVRRAAPGFTAELSADGVGRLRWARHPTWGHVEVELEVAGTAVWLKPRAVVIGRRRWRLPARVPAYPIGMPRFPLGAIFTRAGVESGSVVAHGLLPQWTIEMPLGRMEDMVQQLRSHSELLNLTQAARVW